MTLSHVGSGDIHEFSTLTISAYADEMTTSCDSAETNQAEKKKENSPPNKIENFNRN